MELLQKVGDVTWARTDESANAAPVLQTVAAVAAGSAAGKEPLVPPVKGKWWKKQEKATPVLAATVTTTTTAIQCNVSSANSKPDPKAQFQIISLEALAQVVEGMEVPVGLILLKPVDGSSNVTPSRSFGSESASQDAGAGTHVFLEAIPGRLMKVGHDKRGGRLGIRNIGELFSFSF